MKKTKIFGATMLMLVCCMLIPAPTILATDVPNLSGNMNASEGVVVDDELAESSQTLFSQLQELLVIAQRTSPDAMPEELKLAISSAQSLNETSSPVELSATVNQLTSLLAALPTTTAYDADVTSGDSGGYGEDPADKFEEKHENSNNMSSSSSSSREPSLKEESSPSPKKTNTPNNSRVQRSSVPNTGAADTQASPSAVASSLIFMVATVVAIFAFCVHHKKYRQRLTQRRK